MVSLARSGRANAAPAPIDGEPIKLPENLESLPRADHFPTQRHRWNTNEEIAAILISFDRHSEWQSKEVKIRPKSGSMLLYSRKKVRYRRDGYCWKKRKDGKTTREDHMKLKVQGTECIYGCYVHSAILPTFHRRCYWLLQNPDMVLVHYLNVPYPDDNKLAVITPTLALWADKKEWTKDELVSQLKPMFFSEDEPDLNNELEISTAETVEAIVTQLMEKQRQARSAAQSKQLECGCADSTCAEGKLCAHPMRRISAAKEPAPRTAQLNNQVTSTTGALSGGSGGRHSAPRQDATPPLVLSLSQIQGGGGLLILNSSTATSHTQSLVTSFVCGPRKENKQPALKQEAQESSCCHGNNNNNNNINNITGKIDIANGNSFDTTFRNGSKHEEVYDYAGAETVLVIGSNSGQPKSEVSSVLGAGFFNETLDLSHDDIQRTLSANMPGSALGQQEVSEPRRAAKAAVAEDINPMDFIDSCVVDASPAQQSAVFHGADDDVFVNLDAFDMLGDFPELEILEPKNGAAVGGRGLDFREGTASITDYSPEWAYPEGGVKVLVTGPWYSTTSPYTVLFDQQPQATTLVQTGVLRCYCPAHAAGLVSLQVACEGFVISNAVVFEYKPAAAPVETLAQFSLMRRLEAVQRHIKQEPDTGHEPMDNSLGFHQGGFEDRLVGFCQDMMTRPWASTEMPDKWTKGHRGTTLLHLAAGLGYLRLVCSLLSWRLENSSALLVTEVDARSQDEDGNTPLMLACRGGHQDLASLLHRWQDSTLTMRSKAGHTALEVARNAGHEEIAQQLETLSREQTHDGGFLRPARPEPQKCKELSVNIPSQRLSKRPSVDSGIHLAHDTISVSRLRDAHKLSRLDRSMSLPLGAMLDADCRRNSPVRRMDFALCEVMSTNPRSTGPLDAAHADTAHANSAPAVGEQEVRVLTLAEQIIAAMPDRIKNESDEDMLLESEPDTSASSLSDVFMEPLLLDEPSDPFQSAEFHFEFSDHNYRYYDVDTPGSSLSPASSSCLQSPGSFTLDSPSPPPTTADFCEFFHASSSVFEADFSNLTLSDREQRELYEAAKIIQQAYRSYKGRKKEQDKERGAAVLIQNYYRRYKQYAYFKQMTRAATVIQHGFRHYRESKRFKKSEEAAARIQSCFRSYRGSREATPIALKRTYSQRRQHQAARKIQQFMRQSKNKLQSERAAKEKQSGR